MTNFRYVAKHARSPHNTRRMSMEPTQLVSFCLTLSPSKKKHRCFAKKTACQHTGDEAQGPRPAIQATGASWKTRRETVTLADNPIGRAAWPEWPGDLPGSRTHGPFRFYGLIKLRSCLVPLRRSARAVF